MTRRRTGDSNHRRVSRSAAGKRKRHAVTFEIEPQGLDLSLEALVRLLPAAVVIVEAGTGRILLANDRARDLAARAPEALGTHVAADATLLHADGTPYARDDWPILRCLACGEEIVDEEYASLLDDGTKRFIRTSCAPIREHGRVVAALVIAHDVTDERLATVSSCDIAARTRTEHALEQALREAREFERRRIGRDLHDQALRDLTFALAEAERVEVEVPELAGHLDRLVPTLKRAGLELRGAIYDLRLAGEADTPFPALLGQLVALHRAMGGPAEIRFDVRDGVPTGALGEQGIQVVRILGQALSNARRHAAARTVTVGAWGSEDRLVAEVADDGRGFDATTAAGTGLQTMRERTAELGGVLTVRSAPGEGTRVRLEVPLREAHGEALETVRVLLVEDHAAVREAIGLAFDGTPGFEVVGQAGSLADARQLLDEVDVAVVDLGLPDGYGGDLITELRAVNPSAQAVVLSATVDRATTARAVERGAAAVLDKSTHLDDVVNAVRRLRDGATLMPLTEVVELLRYAGHMREQEHDDRQALARLTPREREVLQALADGLDSQAVADRLHITVRTERNHIASILAKLGLHSRLQALVFALRHGVVEIR